MKAVLALAGKELRLLYRDKFALFWILAFPIMFALFFGAIFANDGDEGGGALSIVVVDDDGSEASRALLDELGEHESLRLVRSAPAQASASATEREAADVLSLEAARDQVRKGRVAAYLRIEPGFGAHPYAVFGGAGEEALLEIGIDPRRQAEAGFLQGVLMQALFGAVQGRFTDSAVLRADLAQAREQVAAAEDLQGGQKLALTALLTALESFTDDFALEELGDDAGLGGGPEGLFEIVDVTRDRSGAPRSAFDITFPQAMVWGLMSVALTFAITLVRERTAGTLLRLRMAPLARSQLLAGKALGCFVASFLTMAVLLGFAALALGVRFDSLPLLLLAMAATGLCFTGLMMTLSVMGKTEAAVAGSAWGLLMPFAMIGGGMIPLIAMPEWLAKLSVISPFKWAITAVEGAVWRGFSASDLLLPCAVLVAAGALFFVVGVAIFRRFEG